MAKVQDVSALLSENRSVEELLQHAVTRAAHLLKESQQVQTGTEKRESARLARMMEDASGKQFTLEMVDRVFRSHRPERQASRLRRVLARYGLPTYLATTEQALLKLGAIASQFVPGVVMSAVLRQLRRDSARVVLACEPEPLARYLASRESEGTRVNVNLLGEAILGEEEAAHRMDAILEKLADPAVHYISVKISAIFSQINLVDWDGTVATIRDRLRKLYRAARPEGKFINLDMEEYRDLALTMTAFQQTLDESEFLTLRAGIVLQAYLPDSFAAQQQLVAWAKERVERGGSPIKMRLVKGANLAMETVEAELHGWNVAPYGSKAETDANYRRMLEYACQPEHARAVNLGVASHNLFDLALALELREQNGLGPLMEVEMLEGMASHQARTVRQAAGGLLVYAPLVHQADFNSAMAYLVRRLDENTTPGNFLRDLFGLTPGSPAWQRQEQSFIAGWNNRLQASSKSRRADLPAVESTNFQNVPDTDWTQATHREALGRALGDFSVPAPPQPAALETVLATATAGQRHWSTLSFEQRAVYLRRGAEVMKAGRFDTIALLVHEGKKAAWEGDSEVSEAVDFANYYATYRPQPGLRTSSLGTVVIAPPWNFPYAIPCGGVLAALMAGNSVILKPAPETVGIAGRLAQQLWAAGIPQDVLQFFPCPDGSVGQELISSPRVQAVVLTGGWETARMFQSWRPSLRLYAETSGKNAIVVTAQADRDLAIKDLVKSTFGHAGQKCSAASLGILEAEVYDDPNFRRQLRDAAASLTVGPATKAASVVTPLIRQPSPALLRALTTLDEGEEWLLEPRRISADECLWSPGIRLGVKPGSWFHQTECFGPVLGLIRAQDLGDAIQIQNNTPFGLTGGIHSLDEAEVATWRQSVEVGNAYINRSITGAIVQRQPFGGWKRSSIGPGAKAGGPNYVAQFLRLDDESPVPQQDLELRWHAIWRTHFQTEHDPSGLHCEANVFRYRPAKGMIVRLPSKSSKEAALAVLASRVTGVALTLSYSDEETESALAKRLPALGSACEFFRTAEPPSDELLRAAHAAGLNWIDAPFVAEGRTELTRWVREQSISTTRHRYGLINEQIEEKR
ncbi:MAG TPA: proline dehydrogenase family protein [Candidatus Limnocylindria bacterium]|nr:proline dehydrogenase family protein [Candidatus Limnocylindria bacterium]